MYLKERGFSLDSYGSEKGLFSGCCHHGKGSWTIIKGGKNTLIS